MDRTVCKRLIYLREDIVLIQPFKVTKYTLPICHTTQCLQIKIDTYLKERQKYKKSFLLAEKDFFTWDTLNTENEIKCREYGIL